ncbi:MAG TPA: hypothetical protein VHL05_07325 [Terriglobales bacterium]|nr:hypothetical protein [Terriglobales bacterium]
MNDKAHVREPVRAVREQATNADALRRVKLLHTIVWAFFASCILAIPIVARTGHMRIALGLIALVAIEVAILLVNGFSCPLTGVAARYTPERQANFDIYLPLWLAKYNKLIFGALYVAAIVYTLVLWRGT